MGNNKDTRDKRDASRIDINDHAEVEYLHQQYPELLHEQVVDQIRRWGPSRKTVMEKLNEIKKEKTNA